MAQLPARFMRHRSWSDALFVHWAVDPVQLGALLPPQLEPDLFEGRAFVGLVLLGENGIRPYCPWCNFPRALEVSHLAANVRTYVKPRGGSAEGTAAIFFFSLDCNSALATLGAMAAFSLPYRLASITHSVTAAGQHIFSAERRRSLGGGGGGGVRSAVRAQWTCNPDIPVASHAGTFAHFVVERYSLYTLGHGLGMRAKGFAVLGGYGLRSSSAAAMGIFRGTIRHSPWRLCEARLQQCETSALEAAGFATPPGAPTVFAALPVEDVDFWLFVRVS